MLLIYILKLKIILLILDLELYEKIKNYWKFKLTPTEINQLILMLSNYWWTDVRKQWSMNISDEWSFSNRNMMTLTRDKIFHLA